MDKLPKLLTYDQLAFRMYLEGKKEARMLRKARKRVAKGLVPNTDRRHPSGDK